MTAFKMAGTSQLAGGFVTFQNNGAGNYSMTLSGNVDVRCARIYNLDNNGLSLNGAGTTVFDSVNFYAGQSSSICYLKVLNHAWDNHNFYGMAFEAVGGGGKTIKIDTLDNTDIVTVTGYATGGTWLSGDATDIDRDDPNAALGFVNWAPTAAEGLSARAERAGKGVLVGWRVASERGTVGYRILRRDSGGGGGWRPVAEVPAHRFGGEPAPESYSWLDRTARGGVDYLYRVEELDLSGAAGSAASAETGGAGHE